MVILGEKRHVSHFLSQADSKLNRFNRSHMYKRTDTMNAEEDLSEWNKSNRKKKRGEKGS